MSKVRSEIIRRDEVLVKQESGDVNKAKNVICDPLLFDRKVALAVEGLEPFYDKILRRTLRENALIIAEYINTVKREINISEGYRKSNIHTLTHLSKFLSNRKIFNGYP